MIACMHAVGEIPAFEVILHQKCHRPTFRKLLLNFCSFLFLTMIYYNIWTSHFSLFQILVQVMMEPYRPNQGQYNQLTLTYLFLHYPTMIYR